MHNPHAIAPAYLQPQDWVERNSPDSPHLCTVIDLSTEKRDDGIPSPHRYQYCS
jgi:hypothetical protein